MVEWRDVLGAPGYKVNNLGQIMSFRRYSEGKLLSINLDKDGYPYVTIKTNKGTKGIKVHRLVAAAFIENPNKLLQVNHKNGIKTDCSPENLEWASNIGNQRHAWKMGLKEGDLSAADIPHIRALLAQGLSNTEIAKLLDTDQSNISRIKTGRTWRFIK